MTEWEQHKQFINHGENMSETKLLLWGFEDAPLQFRRCLPFTYMNGWLAFVCAGSSLEIVEALIARWRLSGQTVMRYEIEDGGIILVGPHDASNKHGELYPAGPEHT